MRLAQAVLANAVGHMHAEEDPGLHGTPCRPWTNRHLTFPN